MEQQQEDEATRPEEQDEQGGPDEQDMMDGAIAQDGEQPQQGDTEQQTAFATDGEPAELSEEQAARLLQGVEEGSPHVVVSGRSDREQDW